MREVFHLGAWFGEELEVFLRRFLVRGSERPGRSGLRLVEAMRVSISSMRACCLRGVLAAQDVQGHERLDLVEVEFDIPALAVEGADLVGGIENRVDERGYQSH